MSVWHFPVQTGLRQTSGWMIRLMIIQFLLMFTWDDRLNVEQVLRAIVGLVIELAIQLAVMIGAEC